MTHGQQQVLATLREHKDAGGRGIAVVEIDHELNRRHNRTMGYDALFSILKRMSTRGFVKRDASRPARFSITGDGSKALKSAEKAAEKKAAAAEEKAA